MKLSFEQLGQGPELLLLHGWGLHSGLWGEFANQLAQHFRLTLIDLPGHGNSRSVTEALTVDSAVAAITEAATKAELQPAIILGWSLGSILATMLAHRYPQRFTHVIWIAGTPSFVARDDWPAGMASATLQGFAQGLQQDYRAMLKRFVSLNSGKGGDRQLLRDMQDRLFERGEPGTKTLEQGLTILRECDVRSELAEIIQPLLLIQGIQDRLVHPDSVAEIRALHEATVVQIENAGHAPFLNEPQRIVDAILEFSHE